MNFSSIFENVSTKLTMTYRKLKRELIQFDTKRSSVTCFEDLSNELIFEIFDFLDFCQIYEAFSNQNIRFQKLLYDPSLIPKIKLTSVSMLTFDRYYRQIIIPHQHSIKSLYLSNQLLIDRGFSTTSIFTEFIQLENLTLYKIKSYYFENILEHLQYLPYLSSLIIDSTELLRKKNLIYNLLFRLPALKFCRLPAFESSSYRSEVMNIQNYSPIEHWITTDELQFDEINQLLTHTLQLRRLTICLAQNQSFPIGALVNPRLDQLTHLSLTLINVKFENFEILIRSVCSYLEVLRISIQNNSDYLDENRWKILITSHLINLRIFDLMISYTLNNQKDPSELMGMIEQFNSPFWWKKQWFFEYQMDKKNPDKPIFIFYTINPYRKKTYKFIDSAPWKTCSSDLNYNFSSVHHLDIQNQDAFLDAKTTHFFNAIELTLADMDKNMTNTSLLTRMNEMIPFERILKLNINLFYGNISDVIKLIHRTNNLRILEIHSVLLRHVDLETIEISDLYQLVSKSNSIYELIINGRCSLQIKEFLINLCPKLKHLTVFYTSHTCKPLLKSLIFDGRTNRYRLYSICITHIPSNYEFNTLKVFVCSDNLLSMLIMNVTRGDFGQEMHLWW